MELLGATPNDVSNAELGHHGEGVSFNSILASVCSHQTACQASSDRVVAVWRKNSERIVGGGCENRTPYPRFY